MKLSIIKQQQSSKLLSLSLVLIVTLIGFPRNTSAIVEDVIDVIHLGKEITSTFLGAWEIVDQTVLRDEIDIPILKRKEKKILARINELSRKLDFMELQRTKTAIWTISLLTEFTKTNIKMELATRGFVEEMHAISIHFRTMEAYIEHSNDLQNNTLIKFAESITSPTYSAQYSLSKIHLLITGSPDINIGTSNIGLLELFANKLQEANSGICDGKQSAQQVLYQLYTAISITELKAYSMMQFSYMILRTYGKGNYTGEARIMHDMFTKRTLKTQELLRKVMERATRYVWRCDPVHAVEGETYEQLTRLLQGYVENEVDMNNDGTCMENCAHYQYTDNFGCYKDMYCAKQPKCKGKLLYCQFIDSDMWICPSKYSETRRYQYIEYENGRVLGKNNQNCLSGTTKVDSWWRYLFWHCSYCLCMCDEQGPLSDRYFNLREATSNITENKVVTGLRFRKHKRIIHLQIQEGELLERGNINGSSLTWKPLSSYGLLDRGIKNGIDYFTMGWDKRAIDLDDVIAPTKHTVTGVRFRVIGTHLNLEIRVTEIDFLTGKLEPDEQKSYWIGNDNTDGSKMRRTMIELKNPDVPTLTIAKSIPDSTTNQFIEFTHSDIDADAAQTTVPFIDIQDVITIPPIPLSGAGIYHKGQPLYGGFVGPKLITYDLSSHIQTPEVEDTNDVELF